MPQDENATLDRKTAPIEELYPELTKGFANNRTWAETPLGVQALALEAQMVKTLGVRLYLGGYARDNPLSDAEEVALMESSLRNGKPDPKLPTTDARTRNKMDGDYWLD